MRITPDELELLFEKTADYLKSNGRHFEIQTDYYAIIPTDEWEEFEKPQIVIGSLFDDAAELKRVLANEIPFTSVDLDRLASLLRALSQSVNPI
ncbi:hypothetical protein [Hymenobacter perfusus]|uniref:Uncharacterized protein n=1 Tax=Hymenobacter perfusus TaxID=1236770 RepID=A0A428K3R7_9BACT|nr:hypothetical protein [Hymenobacter perfusus]RSK40904.1 hypothetical protein EI293_18350 [Hymenobacter perfusus]